MSADPWNVNIHYDARLDAYVPTSATSVLDVGCGDGFLAARLARRVPRVVAIDVDAPVLERAQARFPEAKVTWCHGDMMTYPFARESFDAVVSNATLHHFPNSKDALARMSELVRPGGTLAVVGFVQMERRDWPWAVASWVARGATIRVRGNWAHSAPVAWPPPETFRQLRQSVHEVLPGARVSRQILGRHLIAWQAPA
ncbi:class I SAM-dependent methyltransferase [Actinopolymorpha sp. B11F2]|uniref:class I SAM-dependent methyltransferase n=1 Tax=Actinopolymorpha sp. B11F2 TaxID=3160862 RepID=UPI0032E4A300